MLGHLSHNVDDTDLTPLVFLVLDQCRLRKALENASTPHVWSGLSLKISPLPKPNLPLPRSLKSKFLSVSVTT
jgi:hypothetical protein